MLLEFSANASVSKSLSLCREGKVCVFGCVCDPNAPPPTQVWVHCKYYFFYTLVHSDSFSPSHPHCCHLFLSWPVKAKRHYKDIDSITWKRGQVLRDPCSPSILPAALSWHIPQVAPTGQMAYYTREGVKPRTLDSVYNQIPLNGKFFNSKVWIGWYLKKSSSWLNLESEKKKFLSSNMFWLGALHIL